MKQYLKKILSMALLLVCCLTMVMPVSAADKGKMKVTYKGKTVTVMTSKSIPAKYSTLKKAWGKADKQGKDGGYYEYAYKCGKSSITLVTGKKGGSTYYITCNVKNKKIKVNGITVGMKKSSAYSKLVSAYGKSQVEKYDGYYMANTGEAGTVKCYYNSKGKITKIILKTIDD